MDGIYKSKMQKPENGSWKLLGIWYGYPECCTEEFVYRITRGIFLEERRKLAGTGYIPCKCCNEKYSIDELVSIINQNRSEPIPFKRKV